MKKKKEIKKKKRKKQKRGPMKVFVSYEKMSDIVIPYHKRNKIPYAIRFTNNHTYLDSSEGNYMTEDHSFPMRELIYIQMFKDHIIKEKLYQGVPKVDADKIKFYDYNRKLLKSGDRFDGCKEIDLKSAYWTYARQNLGLVTDKLHKKTIDINPKTGEIFMSKMTRLAAVGSLAKVEENYYFDGEETHKRPYVRSRRTSHVWDHICYKVGLIMQKAAKAAGNGYLFYWTDAIFVTSGTAAKAVERVFKAEGFAFKTRSIQRVKVENRHIMATDYKETRPFPYPSQDKKRKKKG